jgi:hypothetical protein
VVTGTYIHGKLNKHISEKVKQHESMESAQISPSIPYRWGWGYKKVADAISSQTK